MRILEEYPPNYALITTVLAPNEQAIFCYGQTIYNPSGRHLTPDVEYHESIHAKQQEEHPGGIDGWWAEYLQDYEFRCEVEIEAYGKQFAFAKEALEEASETAAKEGKWFNKTDMLKWAKESMALALSGESYGSLMSYGEAVSKIRNYGKD